MKTYHKKHLPETIAYRGIELSRYPKDIVGATEGETLRQAKQLEAQGNVVAVVYVLHPNLRGKGYNPTIHIFSSPKTK